MSHAVESWHESDFTSFLFNGSEWRKSDIKRCLLSGRYWGQSGPQKRGDLAALFMNTRPSNYIILVWL